MKTGNPDLGGPVAVSTQAVVENKPLVMKGTLIPVETSTDDTILGQCAEQSIFCSAPQHEPEIPSAGIQSTAIPTTDGIVDSALLSAMRDPRERRAVLKLEQSMVEFMLNTELQTINVGGPYNSIIVGLRSSQPISYANIGRTTSFQRCWLHRLCDRFQVSRESLDVDWIALTKTEHACIPAKLLINLDPSQYALEEQLTSLTVGSKPVKMKIMKRSGSNSFGSSGSLLEKSERSKSNKKNLPGKEKEKAYAEARARIFSNGMEGDEPIFPTNDAPTCVTTSQVELSASSNLHESSSHQFDRPNASNTGSVSKVTWRNRQQEEADPDFQRQQPYYSPAYHYPQQQQQPHYYGPYDQTYLMQQSYYHTNGYMNGRTSITTSARGRGRGSSRGGRGRQPHVSNMDDSPTLG